MSRNELEFSQVTFEIANDLCRLDIRENNKTHSIKFGYEQWVYQQQELFSKKRAGHTQPVAASYTWKSENAVLLTLCFMESAFTLQLGCTFESDGVTIEINPNLKVDRIGLWLKVPNEGIILAGDQIQGTGAVTKEFKIKAPASKVSINRTIRIDEDLFQKINEISELTGLSFNRVVSQCLEFSLDNLDEKTIRNINNQ